MGKKNYWIGLILSLIFLFFFLRKIDFGEVWEIFKELEYLYTLLPMGLYLFSMWIRAKRWAILLKPIKKIQTGELFKATTIGFMANNILPARIGEVIRAVVIGHRVQISKTASFATVVVERLFDGFTVFILFVAVLFLVPFPPEQSSGFTLGAIKSIGLISSAVYFAILAVLLLLRFENRQVHRLINLLLNSLPERISAPVSRQINAFVSGLAVLQEGKEILVVMAYSLFLWMTLSFCLYLLFIGFHFPLSFGSAVFVEVILVFGVSIPSAPGFIGTFHWICAAGLSFLGVEANQAKSYAMVLWLVGFIPITGLGLFLLWREGLSLNILKKTET
ncbi:MAG: lysylphosphatidylglycerol synthase transmembrane domain-containing protein [Thermodesulfobacteriota bacterium]